MWFFYYAGVYLIVLAIRISSLWNEKSRQWVNGRKNWKSNLQQISPKQSARIWFHVSSLGEFEQGRPVIESIKKERPETDIVLSFFSPSGFIAKRNYPHATVIYLPADLPGNAEEFLHIVKPDLAVFVKYDLWPGYLYALTKHNIPSILISAHWLPEKKMSSWSFPLTKNELKKFRYIFLQRNEHLNYFLEKGFRNIHVAGDTRIDRCLALPLEVNYRLPESFVSKKFDLVAGSTWEPDEKLIIQAIKDLDLTAIIAPHDVSASNIERLTKNLELPFELFSGLQEDAVLPKLVIIDYVGLLSVLYSVGDIAYVGGGFGAGIHNILEPGAHKKAVIFGPKHIRFPEAEEMINRNGAFEVGNYDELSTVLKSLLSGQAEDAGKRAYTYLLEHAGATAIVTKSIMESIPYRPKE